MVSSQSTNTNLIEQVRKLLDERRADEAFKTLSRVHEECTWVRNARAVCLMRLGQAREAARILRSLVFREGTVAMREDVPDAVKLNYVAAMLMTGNVAGAAGVLNEIDGSLPMARRLREAIRAWKKRRPLWSRLAMSLGMLPYDAPVPLDFPPGEI